MAEMTFVDYPADKPKIVRSAVKWDENSVEFHATSREFPVLSRELANALQQATLDCWEGFGLSGYARVDFRVDDAGKPWVLEVNANPCIAADAGFVAAAQRAGIALEQVVEHIVQAALPEACKRQLMQWRNVVQQSDAEAVAGWLRTPVSSRTRKCWSPLNWWMKPGTGQGQRL
jgi:D-alanine-D-alanine ligase